MALGDPKKGRNLGQCSGKGGFKDRRRVLGQSVNQVLERI